MQAKQDNFHFKPYFYAPPFDSFRKCPANTQLRFQDKKDQRELKGTAAQHFILSLISTSFRKKSYMKYPNRFVVHMILKKILSQILSWVKD